LRRLHLSSQGNLWLLEEPLGTLLHRLAPAASTGVFTLLTRKSSHPPPSAHPPPQAP